MSIKMERTTCKYCQQDKSKKQGYTCVYCKFFVCLEEKCNDRFCWRYQCCEDCETRLKDQKKDMPMYETREEQERMAQIKAEIMLREKFGVIIVPPKR